MLLITVLVVFLYKTTSGCLNLDVSSNELGTVRFNQIPVDEITKYHKSGVKNHRTGRASYVSQVRDTAPPIFLYHMPSSDYSLGNGQWIINSVLFEMDSAMAYTNSWSITPYFTREVSDDTLRSAWLIPSISGDGWDADRSLEITCVDQEDRSVYFSSSATYQSHLTGFYVERHLSPKHPHKGVIYSHIRPLSISDQLLYLYQLPGTSTWLVGEEIGIDSGSGYVTDTATSPHLINSTSWQFVSRAHNDRWVSDTSAALYSNRYYEMVTGEPAADLNIYQILREIRSVVKDTHDSPEYRRLRGNDIPLPMLGLGTGGLHNQDLPVILNTALGVGYQMLDTAREYGNEHIIGHVLHDNRARDKVFVTSKVWPTQLGFKPTMTAVGTSLLDLQSNYVDMYLLHWPSCDTSIDWMHCQDTVDPRATWRESWKALERAYAEGAVMSIGVSNFHTDLLEELQEMAVMLPHLVQNWADPTNMDTDVRIWCLKHETVYQPYASVRNLRTLKKPVLNILQKLAQQYDTTIQMIVLRFFIQTGASMIPRSSSREHLESNKNVFNVGWTLTTGDMVSLGWDGKKISKLVGKRRRSDRDAEL